MLVIGTCLSSHISEMVKAATYLLEYFRQELLRKYQLEKPACKKTLNKIKGYAKWIMIRQHHVDKGKLNEHTGV